MAYKIVKSSKKGAKKKKKKSRSNKMGIVKKSY